MPWQRGEGSLEVELSNVQSWVEAIDPKLNGNGRKGLIEQFWEDRAFIKGAMWVLMGKAGFDTIVQLGHYFGLLK